MYSTVLLVVLVILQNATATTVSVEQGILQGEKLWTITGDTLYHSFKGIPYAAPPVGKFRFKVPQPALPWKGIRNATAHGNVCPQFNILINTYIPGDEDCLCLNVYTPKLNPGSLLPVLFYIHGGGFVFGSGDVDNYGPDFIMNLKNAVLVTINYRLNTLGFLCLDTKEVPGNMGLKDQVAALRWVNRNIQSFGGDPNKVTIIGQSIGGSSCTLHAVSPMSKGLFQRAIAMSGTSLSMFANGFKQQRRAFVLGKDLGFDTENKTALLEFLQSVPVEQLARTKTSILAAEELFDFSFTVNYHAPVVEKDYGQERFLIEPPDVSVRKGRVNGVDILLGYTTGEAVALIGMYETSDTIKHYERHPETLVPREIYYKSTPYCNLKLSDLIKAYYTGSQGTALKTIPQFVKYVTDVFNYNVVRHARHLSKFTKNNKIFLYKFACQSERNIYSIPGTKYGLNGVAHFDDLLYLFDAKQYNSTISKTKPYYKMMEHLCSLITNFAMHGNPTPDLSLGVTWPHFNSRTEQYLEIGEKLTIRKNPDASMIKFWETVYNKAKVPF